MSRILLGLALVALLAAGIGGGTFAALALANSGDEGFGGFDHPRAMRLAPDGRVLVADLGSGHGDGRVVAIDPGSGRRKTLMRNLPSARTGQRFSGVAGPSGAAMAADGTVCAVIGGGPPGRPDFASLRCTSGLAIDLAAWERDHNPDGLAVESDPFDVAWDARTPAGWYVSDAAGNSILHVDSAGTVKLVAAFRALATGVPGAPTGLAFGVFGGQRTLAVALFGGGLHVFDPDTGAVLPGGVGMQQPVAVFKDQARQLVLAYDASAGKPLAKPLSYVTDMSDAEKLVGAATAEGATGFVPLPDGRLAIAEEAKGRVIVVKPRPPAK